MGSMLVRWMPWVLLAGGLAWIAKVGVIVATDGEVIDSGAASVLYLLGVAAMALGATGLGARLASGRGVLARVLAAVASVFVFFVSYAMVLDPIAKATFDDLGGAYMRDEHGIWLTGVVWALVAVLLLRAGRRGASAATS